MSVRLRMLGPPRVEANLVAADLPLGKPVSLLCYLACRGDWVPRSELAFLYRPAAAEAAALNYLRGLIFRTKPFAWAADLEVQPERLRWRVTHDVQRFTASVDEERWSDALELYRGRFLDGFQEASPTPLALWIDLQRDDLEALWERAALHRAQALEQRAERDAAAELWERLVARDPYHEQAVQGLMRSHYARGRRDRALAVYDRFRAGLEAELALAPLDVTRDLAARIRAAEALPDDDPIRVGSVLAPAASGAARIDAARPEPTRTPLERTRFVGREQELRQLRDKLASPDCRLLVITGLGGVGKTRLALRLAEAVRADYPHGVALVELAHLGSAAALPQALADALGLIPRANADPWEQVVTHLRDRRMLCLLDNVEQLGSAVGEPLARLLEVAPGLELLVTSRTPLGLRSEWLFELEGLRYPPPGASEPPETFDAVELFLQSAERARHGFDPSEADMAALAAVCRRVEGLPLALELAAAWTRLLSLPDILARLTDGLDLLASEQRDRPERHRSVRATLEASWQQLGPDERSTLAALSRIHGSPTQEAATEIAGAHLPLLLALTNRSLLTARGGGRFGLHALVRQFAAEKLAQMGPAPELEARFGGYYLNLLARTGAEGERAQRLLLDEWDNLRQAWSWAVAAQRFELLAPACEPLRLLSQASGRFRDGIALLDEAAAVDDEALDDEAPAGDRDERRRVVGRALIAAAWLRGWLGDDARAVEQARRGLALLEPLGQRNAVLLGLHTLGHVGYRSGRFEDARAALARALPLARADDDLPAAMGILATLGLVETWLDRIPDAETALLEAHALGRRFERTDIVVESLMALAVLDQLQADPASSRDRLEEALELAERAGLRGHRTHLLYIQGQALLELGRADEARARGGEALELATASDDPMALTFAWSLLGRIALAEADLAAAERDHTSALATAWQRQLLPALPILLIYVAELRLAQGRPEDAAELIGTVFAYAPSIPRVGALARPLRSELERRLDEAAFRTAFERGGQRPLETVVGALL